MFTLFYRKIIKACMLLLGLFWSSLAFTKVIIISPEQRSYLRAEREFNAYEWTCGLVENDYDYVMTVHAIQKAVLNYDQSFMGYILLGYGSAIFIFFGIVVYKYGKPKPLKFFSTLALIAVLSAIPITTHKIIKERTATQLTEIRQLRDKLQTLDPLDPEIIRTCRPDKKNVHIKLIA